MGDIDDSLKDIICQVRILYLAEVSFENNRQMETYLGNQSTDITHFQ